MPVACPTVVEPAVVFRRKRSGRLIPWAFDPHVEQVDLISMPTWDFLLGGMTEAIIIDASGSRWTSSDPYFAGILLKHYRSQSVLSMLLSNAFAFLFLSPSLRFRFRNILEDRISEAEFRAFVLDLIETQGPGFTRAPEEDVKAKLMKRKTLRGMINAVVNP